MVQYYKIQYHRAFKCNDFDTFLAEKLDCKTIVKAKRLAGSDLLGRKTGEKWETYRAWGQIWGPLNEGNIPIIVI